MGGPDVTAQCHKIKVKAGFIADWYISFGKRVESISKMLENDEDPWDDTCEYCKRSTDQCMDCEFMDCGCIGVCYCPSPFDVNYYY